MTRGSEIVREWRDASVRDHRANIRVCVGLFAAWVVVMGLVAEVSHSAWDGSVWGFVGFLVVGYAGFLVVIRLYVAVGEYNRKADRVFKAAIARKMANEKIKFEKYGNKRKDSVSAAGADYQR